MRLLCSLILLLAGCAVHHVPLATQPRTPLPLPAEVSARFTYRAGPATAEVRWEDDEVVVTAGELTVELEAFDEPKPVEFEYWQAKQAASPGPLLLVTPILGGGKELARTHCRDFARGGFHVLLVWRGTKVLRSSWSIDDPERFLRLAVAGRRAALDWAAARPEVDPTRLCAFGISMGGIVSAVLTAVDPRIHSSVLALAGGDLAGIIGASEEGRLGDYRDARMAELGVDLAEFQRRQRAALPSDPLELASSIDPRGVLCVTSRYDDVVPSRYQDLLWEALGRPVRYDVPSGHYTGAIYLPYMTGVSIRWLNRRLAVGTVPGDGAP